MDPPIQSSDPGKRPFWQRLAGLRRRPGARFPWRLTRWGVVLLCFAVVGGSGAGFMEYSMRPQFCTSCHLMEPYYHAWAESTHKDVNCTLCHFEPGLRGTIRGKFEATTQAVKFITGTYGSKPHAQISDRSCLRDGCHEHRLLEGRIKWPVPSERGGRVEISFDHTPHLSDERRGKQLRCVSCHSQMVQGEHIAVTTDTCFLCHFKGFEHGRNEQALGGCESCHDAPKHEIRLPTGIFEHGTYITRGVTCENCHSDSIAGDGEVPRQVCWVCHNLPHQVARYDETEFIHDMHITEHKVRCSNCHIQIEHSLNAAEVALARRMTDGGHLMAGGDCSACHERMHGGPAELYRGVGGLGVPQMPSPMFRAQVDCIACHRTPREEQQTVAMTGRTFTADRDACVYCHGSRYEGMLEDWERALRQHLANAERRLDLAWQALDRSGPEATGRDQALKLVADAGHNVRLVRASRGVHNMNYATALLSRAVEWCDQAIALLDPPSTDAVAGGGP